jgi:hypothetical protein
MKIEVDKERFVLESGERATSLSKSENGLSILKRFRFTLINTSSIWKWKSNNSSKEITNQLDLNVGKIELANYLKRK